MSKANIWALLKAKGFSDNAAAAIMGNMESESNCIAYRLQGDFAAGFQKSIAYTAQVDNGSISRHAFTREGPGGGGYGLCQWTYYSRKEGLYDLAKRTGRSIGDEGLQIDWLWEELNQGEYGGVLAVLKMDYSLREMSDAFLTKFEKPADQSEAAKARRAANGAQILKQFGGTTGTVETSAPATSGTLREATDNWPPRCIQKGMTGFDIGALRHILTALGYDCKAEAEEFDERLKVMTMAYQAENGLSSDGIAGPKTWASLGVRA